jgi:hypothetical protein
MRIHEVVEQRPLLHSAYLTEAILSEQQLIEGLLDSAKSYLGSKFNDTVDDIKGNITDLVQAGILIKDAISCPPVFEVMTGLIGKYLGQEIKTFDALSKTTMPQKVSQIFNAFVAFMRTGIQKISSLPGMVQFFAKLGLYGILKYVNEFVRNPINISETLLDTLKDKVTDLLGGVVRNLSLPGFLTFFNTLKTAKQYFFDLLTYVKKKIESVPPKFRPQAKCANLQNDVKQVAEMAITSAKTMLYEVTIDNHKGWGEVPLNRSVDYHGLRVLMPHNLYCK